MIANVVYKKLGDEKTMTVIDDAKLPLFTLNPDFAKYESIFKSGSIINGTPVAAKVKMNNDKSTEIKVVGLLVPDEEGYYIMPNENLKEKENKDEIVNEIDNSINKIEDEFKKFNPQETLGFNYKQLAVIAIVGLIIVGLSK